MKIPNQSSPIVRKARSIYVSKGVLPQDCFADCMVNTYGIPQCVSAFESRDAGQITACLFNFGLQSVNRYMVGLNVAQCVGKCAFGLNL